MKYSDICPAPKLLVRRKTVEAMIEHAVLVNELISTGKLCPVKPGDSVELYLVSDVKKAVEAWISEANSRR